MSRVRTRDIWSQETTDELFDETPAAKMPRYSQSQASYGYAVPMRYSRRMVGPSYRRKRYKRRIPRAIATRGTPDGYYEIPVRVFWKLYVNTTFGAFVTDPVTGVYSGVVGYQGLAISYDYSSVTIDLGNGAFSATNIINIPGVSELQSVFDLCKMHRVDYEFWWANGLNQSPTAANAAGAPELWVANDISGAVPPGNQGVVLQYSDLLRCPSDPTKRYTKVCYPKQRVVLGTTADPSGGTSTVSGSQAATYFETDKPSVRHTGLIGYIQLPAQQTTVQMYYLNCMMTIYRRFKITR